MSGYKIRHVRSNLFVDQSFTNSYIFENDPLREKVTIRNVEPALTQSEEGYTYSHFDVAYDQLTRIASWFGFNYANYRIGSPEEREAVARALGGRYEIVELRTLAKRVWPKEDE